VKKIYTSNAPQPVGPYSQAILAGDTLYCSGQIALDPQTGEMTGTEVATQTEQICKNIKAVLETAGLTFDNVVKTTCYLTDMNDFASFNEVYAKCFISAPARSCVAAAALPKGAIVEVEVTAVS